MSAEVIVCGPTPDCGDPNINRWYCLRGHELDELPATTGVCHLKRCLRTNPTTESGTTHG